MILVRGHINWSTFRAGGWSLAPRPDKIRRGEAAFDSRGLAAFKFNGAGGWPGRLRLASPRFGHGGRFAAAIAARRRHPQARAERRHDLASCQRPWDGPARGPRPGARGSLSGPRAGVDGGLQVGPGARPQDRDSGGPRCPRRRRGGPGPASDPPSPGQWPARAQTGNLKLVARTCGNLARTSHMPSIVPCTELLRSG